MKTRESWKSKFGFTLAAAGSAVGLANIWRFPYVAGQNGGAAFILIYIICLFAIGIPVFFSEILLGRKTHKNPFGAYKELSPKSPIWKIVGFATILVGLLVSSFYSVIAGWIFGYFIESLKGTFTTLTDTDSAKNLLNSLLNAPYWTVGMHLCFTALCSFILFSGVRKGIERGSKVMMPLLTVILVALCIQGLSSPGASKALSFLFVPKWTSITATTILIALGQAAFTLSLGQGTMITYGSYLSKKDNIVSCALPVVLLDTVISLLAGIAIFAFVFSAHLPPDSGEGLFLETLPIVFQRLAGGELLGILFFLLITLAAITSEISAMEPLIAFLVDEKKWPRKRAVLLCGILTFLIGIPSALSTNLLKDVTFFGMTFFEGIVFLVLNILLPLSGLMVVLFVAWKWGAQKAYLELKNGAEALLEKHSWVKGYFLFSVKYLAPLLIVLALLDALKLF